MPGYTAWVSANPLLSAAIQFGILGTIGEIVSAWMRTGRRRFPFNPIVLLCKIAAWALLGVIIKYGFAGMKGFTGALLEHDMLPAVFSSGVAWAFAVSVLTNLFFGPQMMFIHRLEDNLIDRKWNMTGLTTAWMTLLWFWIPAHTITFSLPRDYQIGLAALWSVVLGIILGFTNKK